MQRRPIRGNALRNALQCDSNEAAAKLWPQWRPVVPSPKRSLFQEDEAKRGAGDGGGGAIHSPINDDDEKGRVINSPSRVTVDPIKE